MVNKAENVHETMDRNAKKKGQSLNDASGVEMDSKPIMFRSLLQKGKWAFAGEHESSFLSTFSVVG